MADVEELVSLSAFLWRMKSTGNLLIAASKAFLPPSHPRTENSSTEPGPPSAADFLIAQINLPSPNLSFSCILTHFSLPY